MLLPSISTTAGGVALGAQNPSQAVASKPDSVSLTAGSSGNTSARFSLVTAKACNLPFRTKPIAVDSVIMKA